jgi:dTDP-4-dehydrorhamnose reductase
MRIQWTYGLNGENFVTKLIRRARANKLLRVVDDQIGSPTATTQVAEAIYKLLSKRPEGVFHFASEGYVSRYEMAKFIFDKVAMDVDLVACKSSDYVTAAARPLNSRFDCSKIKALLGEAIEPWERPLQSFLMRL